MGWILGIDVRPEVAVDCICFPNDVASPNVVTDVLGG
jgi:hypothetical protein